MMNNSAFNGELVDTSSAGKDGKQALPLGTYLVELYYPYDGC